MVTNQKPAIAFGKSEQNTQGAEISVGDPQIFQPDCLQNLVEQRTFLSMPFNAVYINNTANSGGGVGGPSFDEFRLGTTFADVAPIAAINLDGDFDVDGDVDGADFLLWQQGGSPHGATAGDLTLWEGNYGAVSALTATSAVPEPASVLLLGIAGTWWCLRRR